MGISTSDVLLYVSSLAFDDDEAPNLLLDGSIVDDDDDELDDELDEVDGELDDGNEPSLLLLLTSKCLSLSSFVSFIASM